MPAATLIARAPVTLIPVALTLALPAHAAGKLPGTRYYHADHLGSAVAVSDNDASVAARLGWSPYGTPRATSGEADAAGRAYFTGKQWTKSTGLSYFGARYHDPVLGRFLGPDAARQTRSPYAYVGAAPLERVDPDGNFFTLEEIESRLRNIAARCGLALACESDWRRLTDRLISENTERLQRLRARLNGLEDRMSSLHERLNLDAPGLKDHMPRLATDHYSLEAALLFQPRLHMGSAHVDTSYLERRGRSVLYTPPEWQEMLTELKSTTDARRWREIIATTREKLRRHARSPGTILPRFPRRLPGRVPENLTSYAVANRLQHRITRRVRSDNIAGIAPYQQVTERYNEYKGEHTRLAGERERIEDWLDGLIRFRQNLEGLHARSPR